METHSAIALCVSIGGPAFRSYRRSQGRNSRRTNMWLRLIIAVVAGTTAVVATPVQAQTQVDIAPHLGMYFPFNPVVHEGATNLTMRQVSALVVGGRIGVHIARHWLLETTLNYTPSMVAVS